jgi:Ni/Fe-hydrogenase subunit HybB-like protein
MPAEAIMADKHSKDHDMHAHSAHEVQPPVLIGQHTYGSLSDKVASIPLDPKHSKGWIFGFLIAFSLFGLLHTVLGWVFAWGVGVWGITNPIGWGFDIINFVWWVGIGHAGTFISAILFLVKQQWRTSINRFAEAMTLFAVACAGLFPLLHMGRPWRAWWVFPYPNTMGLWPNFHSPLIWDVFAISTYATVSALFWYTGLIPDLATMRDKAVFKPVKMIYGMLAMGWRGSAAHWQRHQMAYLLLAGMSTPLVLSVHTVVSFDFAMSLIPGWHTTIFPPYFVAGAIFSGFAMVLTLLIPIRHFYKMKDMITDKHIDNMAKITLATGWMVFYGYIIEAFMAWYSGNQFEGFMMLNRMTGPYAPMYWALILCNGIIPQLLWFKRVRLNMLSIWLISIVVNIGMWLERFVIIVTSLHRDFMPSSWDMYYPTEWDWGTFIGTIGLFLTLIFLFIRVLPMVAGFEMKELLHHRKKHH